MTQVQYHGFAFERWVKETFFEPFDADYTQKWDVPAANNCRREVTPDLQRLPVSIKTAKLGSPIELGDALRQFSIDEDFLLIVGFWRQRENLKYIVVAEAVKVRRESWRKLWSPITLDDLERLDALIKDKSLSYREARHQAGAMKRSCPYSESTIVLNPKIDSKSQRRLQCSLPFNAFWNILAQREPSESDAATLLEKAIPNPFVSPPRQFKKKST